MKAVPSVRDKAQSIEGYEVYIQRVHEQLTELLRHRYFPGNKFASELCLRLARASYSAGLDIAKAFSYLDQSAGLQIEFYRHGVGERMPNMASFHEYLESLSSAYLVDRLDPLLTAMHRVWPEKVHPWDRALMAALEGALTGRPTPSDNEGMAHALRQKEYVTLPALFASVLSRDADAFVPAMEAYLTVGWGKLAERGSKIHLAKPYPDYQGKWCFFSAAMCKVMGVVPKLSKKVLQYVPVELI